MTYFCCDTLRRSVTAASAFNGIDFVEIVDLDAPTPALRQRLLHVYLLKDPAPLVLTPDNFRIEGGERIRDIRITAVTMAPGGQANLVEIEVDRAGDYSFYRLSLVTSLLDSNPPPQFDAMLASVEFSFKAECPTSFDCQPRWICPCPPDDVPSIDYLARDYESFRRTMLDRMATTIPNWTERNPADLGVTLVELLAFVGDDLSWRQDDAHTEAFLGRARRRASVRRLARLVDYHMSDGTNARTYVHVDVSADVVPLNPGDPPAVPVGAAFTTVLGGRGVAIPRRPGAAGARRCGVRGDGAGRWVLCAARPHALLRLERRALPDAGGDDARDPRRAFPQPAGRRGPDLRGSRGTTHRQSSRCRSPEAPPGASHAGQCPERRRAAHRSRHRRTDHRDCLAG